jgi:hypothetical protein
MDQSFGFNPLSPNSEPKSIWYAICARSKTLGTLQSDPADPNIPIESLSCGVWQSRWDPELFVSRDNNELSLARFQVLISFRFPPRLLLIRPFLHFLYSLYLAIRSRSLVCVLCHPFSRLSVLHIVKWEILHPFTMALIPNYEIPPRHLYTSISTLPSSPRTINFLSTKRKNTEKLIAMRDISIVSSPISARVNEFLSLQHRFFTTQTLYNTDSLQHGFFTTRILYNTDSLQHGFFTTQTRSFISQFITRNSHV